MKTAALKIAVCAVGRTPCSCGEEAGVPPTVFLDSWIFHTWTNKDCLSHSSTSLGAIPQTYSCCVTMCCCFTGPLQVKITSEELTSTSACKEVTSFLCYFQSHLFIKYNLWCFLHQKKPNSLVQEQASIFCTALGNTRPRPPATAVGSTTQIMEASVAGQEGRVFLWAFRISGLGLQHPASSLKLWAMWLI